MAVLEDARKFHIKRWDNIYVAEVFMIEFFAGVGILCAIAKQHNMTQSFAVDKVKNEVHVVLLLHWILHERTVKIWFSSG